MTGDPVAPQNVSCIHTYLGADLVQQDTRHESRAGHQRVLVHDGLLQVPDDTIPQTDSPVTDSVMKKKKILSGGSLLDGLFLAEAVFSGGGGAIPRAVKKKTAQSKVTVDHAVELQLTFSGPNNTQNTHEYFVGIP